MKPRELKVDDQVVDIMTGEMYILEAGCDSSYPLLAGVFAITTDGKTAYYHKCPRFIHVDDLPYTLTIEKPVVYPVKDQLIRINRVLRYATGEHDAYGVYYYTDGRTSKTQFGVDCSLIWEIVNDE